MMKEQLVMSQQFRDEVMELRRREVDSFQDIVQRALSFYRAARDAESKGCKVVFKAGPTNYTIKIP